MYFIYKYTHTTFSLSICLMFLCPSYLLLINHIVNQIVSKSNKSNYKLDPNALNVKQWPTNVLRSISKGVLIT